MWASTTDDNAVYEQSDKRMCQLINIRGTRSRAACSRGMSGACAAGDVPRQGGSEGDKGRRPERRRQAVYRKCVFREEEGMDYRFYGWENALCPAVSSRYPGIGTPRDLYDALSKVWCAQTCTPRMRANWTKENMTWGQCSITAFLAQDIFGGRVMGVPRPEGGVHCYNDVDGCVFDLTSEQFGEEKLCYEGNPEQLREIHFRREEKKQRYELLGKLLLESLS